MTTNLVTFSFQGTEVRTVIIDGETHWVGKDVCEALGYANPNKAMSDHCKGVTKRYPLATDGGIQEFRVITEGDMLRLIVNSKLPEAEKFERLVYEEILPTIRKTGSYATPSQQIESLETRLLLAEQKLQLFEEYNEDILYDFDQVAAAMRIYRKPPFGASHLKKWLADKKILCSAHYKNDKPAQKYIEMGWFGLVMHEWKRRGQRRYEPRYYITQRGFNGMIDMAIRERFIDLPLPKHYCLPNLHEPETIRLADHSSDIA